MAHPVRPDEYHEINNFYTATVYEKGAEVDPHAAHAARRRRLSPAAWTSTSSATTARPSPATTSCRRCRTRSGVDLAQFRAGTRRPARRWSPCAAATTRRRATYTLGRRAERAAATGSRRRSAASHPARDRPRRTRRPRPAAAPRRRADCRGARRASSSSTARRAALRVRRRRRRAGAVAAARLFGAGASSAYDYDDERSRCSRRTTATPSTAGTRRSACSPTRSCASRHAHRGGAPLAAAAGARARGPATRSATTRADPSLLALALATARRRRMSRRSNRSIDPDGIVAAIRYIERALAASLRDDFVERLSALPAPRSLRVGARTGGQRSLANRACAIWARSTTMPRTRSLIGAVRHRRQHDRFDRRARRAARLAVAGAR